MRSLNFLAVVQVLKGKKEKGAIVSSSRCVMHRGVHT